MTKIDIGYVPLTDAAPLIVALELGFAYEEGIQLTLHREVSWANIRDKIGFDIYQGAHMLSPMPIAMAMGMGPTKSKPIVPMILSQNGNGLVVKPEILSKLNALGAEFNKPASIAQAMTKLGAQKTIRIGVPFMQSMHVSLMRYLLEQVGGEVGKHIAFVVAPPSLASRVLEADEVDGFMVGAPYYSEITKNGAAELLLLGSKIWSAAPEKVLALSESWAEENHEAALALIRAIYRSLEWVEKNKASGSLAELLAKPKYLNLPTQQIEDVLNGQINRNHASELVQDPLAIRFDATDVSFPWRSQAQWISQQEAPSWGILDPNASAIAEACFRPDLYREALSSFDAPVPIANSKVEGSLSDRQMVPASGELVLGPDLFFDGSIFEPKAYA